MKKIFWLLSLSLLLSGCFSSIDENPVSYNNHITKLVSEVDTSYEAYNQLLQQKGIDDVIILQKKLKQTIKKTASALIDIKDSPAYQSNADYRDSAIVFATNTLRLLREQETKLLALYTEVANYPDNERTPDIEKSYKGKQQSLINTINEQIKSDNTLFQQAQQTFAKQYNLTLTGSAS